MEETRAVTVSVGVVGGGSASNTSPSSSIFPQQSANAKVDEGDEGDERSSTSSEHFASASIGGGVGRGATNAGAGNFRASAYQARSTYSPGTAEEERNEAAALLTKQMRAKNLIPLSRVTKVMGHMCGYTPQDKAFVEEFADTVPADLVDSFTGYAILHGLAMAEAEKEKSYMEVTAGTTIPAATSAVTLRMTAQYVDGPTYLKGFLSKISASTQPGISHLLAHIKGADGGWQVTTATQAAAFLTLIRTAGDGHPSHIAHLKDPGGAVSLLDPQVLQIITAEGYAVTTGEGKMKAPEAWTYDEQTAALEGVGPYPRAWP